MPRITLEKKIPIGNGISEIKEVTYDLPDHIVYKGQYMSYDSYHKGYQGSYGNLIISAKDYLKETLSCGTSRKRSDTNKNQQESFDSSEKN